MLKRVGGLDLGMNMGLDDSVFCDAFPWCRISNVWWRTSRILELLILSFKSKSCIKFPRASFMIGLVGFTSEKWC